MTHEYAHLVLEVLPPGTSLPDKSVLVNADAQPFDVREYQTIDGLTELFRCHEYLCLTTKPHLLFEDCDKVPEESFCKREGDGYILTAPLISVSFEILNQIGSAPARNESNMEPFWSPSEWEMENGDRREYIQDNFLEEVLTKLLPFLSLEPFQPKAHLSRNQSGPTRQIGCILEIDTTMETSRDLESGIEDVDAVYSEIVNIIGVEFPNGR